MLSKEDTYLTSRHSLKGLWLKTQCHYLRGGRRTSVPGESQVSLKQEGEENLKGDSEEVQLIEVVICVNK